MAKWIYERWQPKWPEFTGSQRVLSPADKCKVLSYDGTLQDEIDFTSVVVGEVFYKSSDFNAPAGYYCKTSSFGAATIGTDPPLPIKDTLIDTIEAEEGTYPDDGVHSDQLYYVKVKPAFPTMRILRDGQWAEVETGYVLKDGVWKPIEEIYKLQDGQWVQA